MSIAFRYASTRQWLIKEDYLKLMLEIASRSESDVTGLRKQFADSGKENKSRPASMEGQVKVIPVIGPIVRHADMFSEISGATALSSIMEEFDLALQDESVSAILFDIDSPGGEAAGINEFAEKVFNARGIKPMISYVGNQACSAAYWIASATDEIVCDETAVLGSIGCAGTIIDTSERDAKEGIKNIEFVSSNSPNKRPDVNTDEGKALIQKQIDDIGNIFIKKVARNRSTEDNKLTSKNVINDFNQGGVLTGKDAVKAGLADKLGSKESVLKNITGVLTPQNTKETSMKLDNKDTKVVENEEVVVADNKEDTPKAEAAKAVSKAAAAPQISVEEFTALKETAAKTAKEHAELVESLKTLQAKNFDLEQQNLKTEAKNKALSLKDRMLPAQEEGFIAQYIQNANDDASNPIDGYSRVENFLKIWEAMPQHKLTEERMEDSSVLENPKDVDAKAELAAELDNRAKALAAKLNKKNASR